jgi:hypothetical protein
VCHRLSADQCRTISIQQSDFATETKAKPASSSKVLLSLLRPTQAAVGMRTVSSKQKTIEKRQANRDKFDRFLDQRPFPAIRGPGQLLYIVDHHHLGVALLKAGVRRAVVTVIDDQSHLPPHDFWAWMTAARALHPFDADGRPIAPGSLAKRLPQRLRDLAADPYRDLATFVRRAGGFAKCDQPFSEFSWANHFRTLIPAELVATRFSQAVSRALVLARKREAAALPGFIGR